MHKPICKVLLSLTLLSTSLSLGLTRAPLLCSARGISTQYEYIKDVKIDAYTDSSGTDGGYRNVTDRHSVKPGVYSITLTPGYINLPANALPYALNWRVWLDVNRDGKLTDSEVLLDGSGAGSLSGVIQIPNVSTSDEYRLRVEMKWGSKPLGCENPQWGEVQDYLLLITNKPWNNEYAKLDVNEDLCFTSLDILVVINALNSRSYSSSVPLPGFRQAGSALIDVDGDGYLSPIDLLQLNNANSQGKLGTCYSPPLYQAPGIKVGGQ